MVSRSGFSASGRRLVAALVLLVLGVLFAGASTHAHIAPGSHECAICKAASSAVTLETAGVAVSRPEPPSADVAPTVHVIFALVLALDRPTRAPPAR